MKDSEKSMKDTKRNKKNVNTAMGTAVLRIPKIHLKVVLGIHLVPCLQPRRR